MDPTFTRQFGQAVQADILRQSAIEQQDWQPRARRERSTPLLRLAQRLLCAVRPLTAHDHTGLDAGSV